jgi:enoyl-CoA hydratase
VPVHYDEVGGHVVRITIDRPATRNALDLPHFQALAGAWHRFRDDADAWVAVLTGVGRSFFAGGDLKAYVPLMTSGTDTSELQRAGTEAVLRRFALYKPVIAAVNGPCLAGGMELLGATDIRIATPYATFGLTEPKRGLFAGGGSTVRLPRQMAFPAAMEFLLTAEALPAARALEVGLINEVVQEDVLWDRALEWAHRITANAPLAVQATKESVLRAFDTGLDEAYARETEISHRIFATEDAREGPAAFAEKRAPRWNGR